MKHNPSSVRAAAQAYERLRTRLAKVGWISQGYVQDRGPGASGPCYQWTRKVKAKTVSVALAREPRQLPPVAFAQNRLLDQQRPESHRFAPRFQEFPHIFRPGDAGRDDSQMRQRRAQRLDVIRAEAVRRKNFDEIRARFVRQ